MPTWGGILAEFKELEEKGNKLPFDYVRRKYLATTYQYTKRNTILYATKWTQPDNIAPDLISITEEDIQGLMEVIHGLDGSKLDLIVHSPGGSPEATEALVSYLRTKFDDIRVIIPQSAMSAATMLACASNRIVMGKHSYIGPIDPQMILQTPLGIKAVPAQAILDQFNLAMKECEDPKKLGSWLPILSQYGPALLVECENALKLSQELVSEWLEMYMFDGRDDSEYLFSWDEIPGNDNGKLIEFLKQKFGIDWVKTAEIEKIDNGNTIKLSTEINHLSLNLNQEKTEVIYKIDDDKTDKFIAKMENGKLNIYDSEKISALIASYLANHQEFKTHSRHINREKAKSIGLIIDDLEADQIFQDNILSIFHSTTHTFNGTNAVKIIENHNGKAFIKHQRQILVQQEIPAEPNDAED